MLEAQSFPNEVTSIKAGNVLLSQFIDDKLNYHQAADAAAKRLRVAHLEHYQEPRESTGRYGEYLVLAVEDTDDRSISQYRFTERRWVSETEKFPRGSDLPKIYKRFDAVEHIKGTSTSPKFDDKDELLASLCFSTEAWPVYLYEMVFLIMAVVDFPVDSNNWLLRLSADFAAGLVVDLAKSIFKGVFPSHDSQAGWWKTLERDDRVPTTDIIDDVKSRYEQKLIQSGMKDGEKTASLNNKMLNEIQAELKAIDKALQVNEVNSREERTNPLTTSVIMNTLKEGFSRLDKRQTQIEAELHALRMALKAGGPLPVPFEEEKTRLSDTEVADEGNWVNLE